MLAVAAADDTHLRGLEPSPAETAMPGVLTIIAFVLDRLVARNDQLAEQTDGGVGWDLAPVGTSLSTFHGPLVFVVGYVYIDRLVHRHPNSLVVSLNVHRLLVTSVMVASKMLDDVHFNNAFYARVGGVSNSELNRLELELLFLLDFGVTVNSHVFESYCVHLEMEMLWNGTSQKVERVLKPNSVEDVTEMPLEEAQSSSPSNGTMS
ncbi:cyclin p2;1 [Actinidia rufa]|uniref:Cyclin n=1 Tax=Actinidia rufa TaxID=165716 RepID=A0A7J0H5M5_9ERIC|nr:cyclin p2;1 [Actinidia rufa]